MSLRSSATFLLSGELDLDTIDTIDTVEKENEDEDKRYLCERLIRLYSSNGNRASQPSCHIAVLL